MKLFYERAFDAAHFLPDYNGKCKFMHGHTWKVKITITSPCKKDIFIDFNILKVIIDDYDHKILNKKPKEWESIPIPNIFAWGTFDYPSAENIAKDVLHKVWSNIEQKNQATIEVEVWESDHSAAIARSDDE